MKTLPYPALFLILALASPAATAANVYRCVDHEGRVTFTRHGCAQDQESDTQRAFNATPGSGKPVPMAKPAASSRSPRKDTDALLVVGGTDDGCGNQLTSQERRIAILRKQAKAGMSMADVESALGKPTKTSTSNGLTRYSYRDGKGKTRSVNFDENGCVRKR
ncbi:hypothetical protein DN824_04335 [Stutzerimonas nosocomialis]|uniref:DUF4124 domain-containing protein n=2 Tax=Stutzerimonas nosocomialis TaxID=1056496 RepID=A0A5R9QE78_9GAMM|nr:DUF4124 domain-containing protein [Stutzerimonas nosocomialis]TLX59556.1 hypothetical protein DN826_01785 [Stutzerimonas nosocomialis]TLX60446.1 hypothetical protein DN824_04335 [Stutzerimonas nosocomialis]TLX62995.1 hypothetical protein DN820_13325 [Stutzerimonas nosocomialis]